MSATPPDIFISYAREDVEWVRPLAAELGSLGRSVFWDRRIPAGESWHSHIGAAVRGARCVVVVWSAQSIESEWVLEEAGQGKRRRVLVPVLKEAVEPPLGFGLIQAADLAHWRRGEPSEEFAGFLGDLARLLDPGLTAVPSTAGPLDPVEPASIQPVTAMLEPARQGESVEGSEATGADDTDISGTATPATSAGAGAASFTGEHLADDTVLLPVAGPSIGLDKHRARVAEQPALAYAEQGQTRDDRCGDARRPSTRIGADGSPSLSVAHSATRTAPWPGRRRKWLAGVALVATLGVAAAPHVVSRFRPELPASALGGRSSVGEVATSSGRPATELSATAKSPAPAREEPDIPQSPDDQVTEIESLGITVASLSVLQRQKYGIDSNTAGILVTKVAESSSAAGESIEPGDVIQEVGQEEVNSPQEMARMVQVARDKGKKSLLLLMNRADDLRFVAIRFAESPPVANMMTSPNSIAEESSTIQSLANGIIEIAAIGITAAPLQEPQRPKYGLEHSQAGVLIAKVVEGSSAKDEELKSGDVIQEINQEEVVSPREAANKIKSAQDQGKRSILMLINREGDLRFVALRLE